MILLVNMDDQLLAAPPRDKRRWIYRIPLCGGCCAPTESPERTPLRRLGNEFTLPAANCCESYRCRSYFEHARLCVRVGGLGVASFARSRWRARIMLCSASIQLVSTLLYVIGALAMSTDESLVRTFAWASFELWSSELNVTGSVQLGIQSRVVSLRGVAFNGSHFVLDPAGVIHNTVRWDNTSCFQYTSAPSALVEACSACRHSMHASVSFILLSIIAQVPTISTNLQRTTPYADVNCQKFMGIATGLCGLFTGLMALRSFGYDCWRSVPNVTTLGPYNFSFTGKGGTGFFLFLVGICLKITDVLAHLLLPTPAPKRQPVEPGLAFSAYLQRCPEITVFGAPVESQRGTLDDGTGTSAPLEALLQSTSNNTCSSVSTGVN